MLILLLLQKVIKITKKEFDLFVLFLVKLNYNVFIAIPKMFIK